MKKLEDMNPRDYGMNPREEIVAAAIKAYLLSMPEVERLKVLSEITEPKVIKLHGEGGVPMPLQSVVEGAKLAAFIDDAVADSIRMQRQSVSQDQMDALPRIEGKVFIQSMSVDVIQFVADAYRCLKY